MINIIWNAIVCTGHFFLSITHQNYSYEYGIPSMTYFLLFSIFELKLLFFVWRARNIEFSYSNPLEFKRKLFRFYIIFCKKPIILDLLLFFSLIFIKYIFSQFWTSLVFFSATWFFQIIHNARTGTRPPMSLKYIVTVSLGKLFIPVRIL
jgi:hypothetical protein